MKKSLESIIEKIENNETLTSEEKRQYIKEYSLTVNHTGKMQGMVSLSTSCLVNPYCIARRKKDSMRHICPSCYAAAQLESRTTNARKFLRNFLFFTKYELQEEDIPVIHAEYFRFESFGDVYNVLQVKNYYMIRRVNAKTIKYAAIWSKNPHVIAAAGKKPRNLVVIYSNEKIDNVVTAATLEMYKKEFPVIDKIFSVYRPTFAKALGININCGDRHCRECTRCYHKSTKPENNIINEKQK